MRLSLLNDRLLLAMDTFHVYWGCVDCACRGDSGSRHDTVWYGVTVLPSV